MRPKLDLERVSTVLVVLVTVVTVGSIGVVNGLKLAAVEMQFQLSILRDESPSTIHTAVGQQLAGWLSGDVPPGDIKSLEDRAVLIDHRADRLLEATAVVALGGMLVVLVTLKPAGELARARSVSAPVARTSSNGTV